MVRTFCLQYEKDWDDGVHLLLFAGRDDVQEFIGFSPFELVVGHTVSEPLQLVKEKWLDEFKEKIYYACKVAQDNLKHVQHRMKVWYDTNAKVRIFQPGDKVIVFSPVPGQPL